jgi:hypothetical protein
MEFKGYKHASDRDSMFITTPDGKSLSGIRNLKNSFWYFEVCVLYYCLTHSIHASIITRCVCFIIICNIIYIQTKLLQCYYGKTVNLQSRLCDVQDPGDDG